MLFLRVCLCGIYILQAFSLETEVVVLRAGRGRDARLPCGQGKVFLDGPDSYVLWLKNDRDVLYRFPNEDTASARSVNRDHIFGKSCDSGLCYDDTSLLLKRVSNEDAGIYRCRVHYQASPSVDFVINVKLVENPGMPKIYNEAGDIIKQGHIGPISLGSNLTLICEVNDETPDTIVYWRRNGVVSVVADNKRPGVLRAEVRVRNATRSDLDAHYECLATNADVTEPLTASVIVKMFLPPISVEIRLNNNYNFEMGQPRVVDCVVVGCVPPPSVTWHLGDRLLRPNVHKELHDGNYTVSSLTLAPSLRDDKHELICKAHNSLLPEEVFENKVTLNVGYRPICATSQEVTIGVVEREAETLICTVEATPEPLQFSWTFSDFRTLYTSVKKVPGFNNRYASTLTWLPRDDDFGQLCCRATNSFGEQKKSCTYAITAGGAPFAPECGILRSSPDKLAVECQKGWNGGRPQAIHLELFNNEGYLIRNISNSIGHFEFFDVDDENNFTIKLYASNNRGTSVSKIMHIPNMNMSFLNATAASEEQKTLWSQATQAGTAFAIVLLFIVFIALCLRSKSKEDTMDRAELSQRSDGAFHREPAVEREERLLPTTHITVNPLTSCQNGHQHPAASAPSCRVLVRCPSHKTITVNGLSPIREDYFV